jgi:hypothetical protein
MKLCLYAGGSVVFFGSALFAADRMDICQHDRDIWRPSLRSPEENATQSDTTQPTTAPSPATRAAANKIHVAKTYTPSIFMGDGESPGKYVQYTEAYKEDPKSSVTCIKVAYTPGPENWAGMYWQNKPNNWGDNPGDDLSTKGFTKITFRARGEKDGDVVEFKAGGINDPAKKYKDSFEVTKGKVTLSKDWTTYEISLEGKNLSSVIGVFCWVVSTASNPGGVTFYLDDIQYQ